MNRIRSTGARFRALLEAIEIIHSHGQSTLRKRIMTACQHLFPESYHGFELWERTTGCYEGVHDAPFDSTTVVERFQRLSKVIPRDNPSFAHVVAGVSRPLRISDYISLRQLRRTEFFDLAYAPLGLKHQVVIPIQNETHQGGVCFNRGGQRDFTEDEMEIIRLLGKHTIIAHQTDKILSEAYAQRSTVGTRDHTQFRRAGLTKRECEVLQWMAQGKRDKEIAVILGVSYRTITNHVGAILAKMKVETRTAAVKYWIL